MIELRAVRRSYFGMTTFYFLQGLGLMPPMRTAERREEDGAHGPDAATSNGGATAG
jgi:hypothetical protein